MTRIYISSTYSDLVEHRQRVYDILRKMRYDVMAMEDYVAADKRPLDKCLADVASCDLYIGIFAWRYGYVPPGQERSITELMDSLRARRDQADRERREMRARQRVVNLRPLDVAHFKDRLREIQALCDHLADTSVRLVSVVGRGGMGKTALASRVLADLERGVLPVPGEERELPVDGILYLSARSTGLGLERIYADVGRMLGEPTASKLTTRWAGDAPLAAKVEYMLETMRDGLYLILLDNLEEELTEEGTIAEEGLRLFVERCLTQPDGIRLVVTSREEVQLAAATLRGARCIPLREGLPEDEAVTLLRDLDPQGTLGLRDAPEDALRRTTRLTQGIPRALEILAGILHQDPTASLPRLLADEATFGAEVVEQLVAQGYRRLGDDEKRIMGALAVFDRPVDETTTAYLLHPWFPGLDVRAGLRRLVSGYFVSVNRVTGEYSLHPLDREYAYHQLPDDEEAEGPEVYNRRDLELRAADFYAGIRKPESEWKTIEDLVPQLAEFEHRVRAGDYDGACRVLEPIDDYLYLWGHYARLVKLREKLLGRLTDSGSRATNLGSLGFVYYSSGQFGRALEFLEKALFIAHEIGDRPGEGRHLGNLARAYRERGQFERATEFQEKALSIAHEISDRPGEGRHLGNLGLTYRDLGHFEQAIRLNEEALTIARENGDRAQEGLNLGILGSIYSSLGQIERALKLLQEALVIAREVGDRREESYRLGNLGLTYRSLGQFEQAIKLHEEALTITREIGNRRGEEIRLGCLGTTYRSLGQFEQAIKFHEEALTIAREISDRRGESYCLLELGKALLASGKLSEANRRCWEARDLDMPQTSYQAALALGIVLLYQRDAAAGEIFADAAARCQAMLDKTASLYEARYALAASLVGSAVCNARWAEEGERAGLLAPALEEYQRTLENCAAPGVVQDALRDLEMIQTAGAEGLEPVFKLLESV